MYKDLLHSPNYVTKRQSLKLLGEILLDRTNFNIMTRYISSEENLKDMMNLLKDKSKNIQFEAFHVFKVSPFSMQHSTSKENVTTYSCETPLSRSLSPTQRNHQSLKTS
jgi:calcium binding protein 39